MTWSILAHDPQSGAFAVAVATCNFAVGATCPYLRHGVGAVSTQSIANRYLGPAVLDNLARGLPPETAIKAALAADEGAELRQIQAIDRHGRTAAFTGRHCVTWCGSESAPHIGVAGNMLSGEAVVHDTMAAMRASNAPLPERLMAAMHAGEQAGGDRRGRQSAAMVLTTTEDFPDLDLRVDDHATPLQELDRLLQLWRRNVAPTLQTRPRRANPPGLIDLETIESNWIARGLDIRFRR